MQVNGYGSGRCDGVSGAPGDIVMTIQDLLLPITGTAGDSNALAAAVALSSHFGAHLSVVEPITLPTPFTGPWGMMPDTRISELYRDLRDKGSENAAGLRQKLDKEGISFDVRTAESLIAEPPQLISLQARYADLIIVTAPARGADDAAVARDFFGALLFESGRPVLAIPPHHPIELPLRHAVIAWQPAREATRALHDALPLLTRATSVDVVTVAPIVSEMRHGEDPGVDIASHLARHGLNVNVVSLPHHGNEAVATTLLRHAAESGAQLLVAGGYGHSRLREWMLGGTTRELLQAIHLPILFSH
jgi:nucleotide-binding universal stress UspA family protein